MNSGRYGRLFACAMQFRQQRCLHLEQIRYQQNTPLPVLCRFLGRRDDEAIHALWRPASEKRQGTKSREVGGGGAADAMGIWLRGEA
jgi:hypothetical protein